jgi:uncharacterized protein
MVEKKTRKREITALWEAMTEQKLSEGIIVTRYESETIESEHGTIHVIPVWKFLLDFSQ